MQKRAKFHTKVIEQSLFNNRPQMAPNKQKMTNSKSVFHSVQFKTLPDLPETLISENAACKELGVTPEILRAFCSLYCISNTGEIKGAGIFYRFAAIEEIISGNHMKNFIYQISSED